MKIDVMRKTREVSVLLGSYVGRKVAKHLESIGDDTATVKSIQNAIELDESHVSGCLKKMRDHYFVEVIPNGKFRNYRLTNRYFETVKKLNALWEAPKPQKQSSEN